MNFISYRTSELHCEAIPLKAIADDVGTPVYVYSRGALTGNAEAYLAAAPPGSLICYALKANSNPTLLRLLGQMGLGADVTSGGELFLAQHAGIPPERIIYSGVGKTAAEIEMALVAGIRALHIESEAELTQVADIAATLNLVADIGLRVNPNISADTHPYIRTGLEAHKFGVLPASAMHLIGRAANHPWLNPVALATHIGSQIIDLAPFVAAAEFLASMAAELSSAGIQLSYLDVGGGLGIDYANEGVPSIQSWAAAVAQPVIDAGYSLVMEPGRSIVGPAGLLLTQAVYTKQRGDKNFIITDAGMSDLIRPTLYHAHHPIWPIERKSGQGSRRAYDVVGPLCETGDFLAKDRLLPEVSQGDYLAVMQAGAYGFAMSSNYNGHLRPAEVLVDGNQYQVIRHRQTYHHLLDGC